MKFLSILTMLFGFSQCGSTKLVENPPFNVESAVYTNWVGGQPGSSGMNVVIRYTSDKEIEFDSLYYSKRISKLEVKPGKDSKVIVGHFNTSVKKNDLILDVDSKKELHNKIPEINKLPFELKENEAVISYKIDNKVKYFKIENLKKGKPVFFPSARPRN
ncbi:hypothetical protein [uncultured Polaribacter sp.]|uniref:hypothetical protein n=1 Tax=uncultured Polaribacter sp. TaxID=174711 RepID=UPI00260C941A|nr:hypothetical protein [uncultured Polaribacter sp.]